MLLERLRSLEAKNIVLDQVSSVPPEASLVSLNHTDIEIQVPSNQLPQASLKASPKEKLDKDVQASKSIERSSELKEEEYLAEPEEKKEEEFSIGDRIVDLVTGNRGIVTGYRDGRVVFDNKDFGRCSRPAMILST